MKSKRKNIEPQRETITLTVRSDQLRKWDQTAEREGGCACLEEWIIEQCQRVIDDEESRKDMVQVQALIQKLASERAQKSKKTKKRGSA